MTAQDSKFRKTRQSPGSGRNTGEAHVRARLPRAAAATQGHISEAQDFANVMGALMTDLISGAVPPQVGNAMCNAGSKLLKAVEMQMKYGAASKDVPGKKVLVLTAAGEQQTVQ